MENEYIHLSGFLYNQDVPRIKQGYVSQLTQLSNKISDSSEKDEYIKQKFSSLLTRCRLVQLHHEHSEPSEHQQ